MKKEMHKMMPPRGESGFTLIEILIAIAILAFGLLAVATMQVTGIRTNARANSMSQGLTLAQDKVEELISLSYDHSDLLDSDGDGTDQDTDNDGIDDDGGNFGLDDTVDGGGNIIADNSDANGRYTTYWNVVTDEPATNSKTIRVIVTWTERGRNKRVALDFIRANLS
jgi:type IV pilus assembly protein PilV